MLKLIKYLKHCKRFAVTAMILVSLQNLITLSLPTIVSTILDNGVDKRLVMEQMGHNSIQCTENFYHRDRKDDAKKNDIINKLDDFYSKGGGE